MNQKLIYLRLLAKIIFYAVLGTYLVFSIPVFLLKNKGVFKNKYIYLDTDFSFGYQVFDIEILRRLVYPQKIAKIELLCSRKNRFLHLCYSDQVKNYNYQPLFLPQVIFFKSPFSGHYLIVANKIFAFYIFLAFAFMKPRMLFTPRSFYNLMGDHKEHLPIFYNEISGKIEPMYDVTGLTKIIRHSQCPPTKLPSPEVEMVENAIKPLHRKHKTTKIAYLLFRKSRTDCHYDKQRDVGDIASYKSAIDYLSSQKFLIIGDGDISQEHRKHLTSLIWADQIDITYDLLNIYLLTQSDLFISQHSGAYILPNCANVPVILTNSFPFFVGTFNFDDVILFKNVFYDNKEIKINDVISKHSNILYGEITHGYRIVPNSEKQLLDAVKGTKLEKLEFPKDTHISKQPNFICVSSY